MAVRGTRLAGGQRHLDRRRLRLLAVQFLGDVPRRQRPDALVRLVVSGRDPTAGRQNDPSRHHEGPSVHGVLLWKMPCSGDARPSAIEDERGRAVVRQPWLFYRVGAHRLRLAADVTRKTAYDTTGKTASVSENEPYFFGTTIRRRRP